MTPNDIELPEGSQRLPDGSFVLPRGRTAQKFVTIINKNGSTRIKMVAAIKPKVHAPDSWHRSAAGIANVARARSMKKTYGRTAIPHGYDRKTFDLIMKVARTKAEKALKYMADEKIIDLPEGLSDEAVGERESLLYLSSVVIAKLAPLAQRTKAADTFLKYTRGARVKNDVSVSAAEDLLEAALKHGAA